MSCRYIVLIIAAVNFIFQMYLYILNAGQRKKPLPQNVRDVYDDGEYKRWTEYSAEKNRISFFVTALSFIMTVIFISTDIISAYSALLPSNEYLNCALVMGSYILLSSILSFGFDYISDIAIEKKYGFNNASTKTFIGDQIKNTIISLVLECGLVLLCLFFYNAFGAFFFIALYIAIVLFVILISTFSLAFQKLFNKFTPLEDGTLRERLVSMFEKEGYKIKEVYVMDASLRTKKVNAFCAGLGKLKEIVLYDNLLNNYTEDEITAVFAHELEHFKHKDTLSLTFINSLTMLPMVLLLLLLASTPDFSMAFGFPYVNFPMIFIAMSGALLEPLMSIVSIPVNAISRHFEYRADAYARSTGNRDGLVSALKKISRDNFSNLNPHPLIVRLEYSHPTLSQRIDRLK